MTDNENVSHGGRLLGLLLGTMAAFDERIRSGPPPEESPPWLIDAMMSAGTPWCVPLLVDGAIVIFGLQGVALPGGTVTMPVLRGVFDADGTPPDETRARHVTGIIESALSAIDESLRQTMAMAGEA